MKCPCCSNELSPLAVGSSLTVDVCRTGCAGIWFDEKELASVDEVHELKRPESLRTLKNAAVAIDRERARACPKCTNEILHRVYYDPGNCVEVDRCLKCAGVWLDIGELEVIQDQLERDRVMNETIAQTERSAKAGGWVSQGFAAVVRLLFSSER